MRSAAQQPTAIQLIHRSVELGIDTLTSGTSGLVLAYLTVIQLLAVAFLAIPLILIAGTAIAVVSP